MEFNYEQDLFSGGIMSLGALDEAGRGPLAGPVVAACVLVKPGFVIPKTLEAVKDSKKLSEKKREELFEFIMNEFAGVGVGICDHETIDRINILEASFLAMKKAIGALEEKADYYLIDGKFPISNSSIKQEPIIKGDSLVFSIAAASIIAKVSRDRIMRKAHEEYPEYGFDKHKGYGTKAHLVALKKHGPCAIHRLSFGRVKQGS